MNKEEIEEWLIEKRKLKIPDETAIELQEKLAWAEDLTQTVVVQLMHTLGENGVDISENAFVRDVALIIEMTKGSIYRSLGLKHPTQGLFEGLVELSVDPDNTIATEVNQEVLEEYIKMFGDDDDPEIS